MGASDRGVRKPDETLPPGSGVVDAAIRVVVCSRDVTLEGEGEADAVVARDVADLLMALDESRRVAILVDTRSPAIDLKFLARLARDFPPTIAIFVEGVPSTDRRAFHDQGVYRAQFDAHGEGLLAADGRAMDRARLVADVRARLERMPTPLVAAKGS